MECCGAKTRKGTPCQQPSGWGTEHLGEGRCKLHGGCTPRGQQHPRYKHGRYARYDVRVHSATVRGLVGVNDATARFDDAGRCAGLVQISDGPLLDIPAPLRPQDIAVFEQLPGYEVTTSWGLGALYDFLRGGRRRLREHRKQKCAGVT